MKEVDVSPKELDKIVVANGPGSYTGVRIGVTTAKTMAWSLNIPVIGVSSLAVMAQAGRYFQGIVSPIMDARRGQVYTGCYMSNDDVLVGHESDRLVMLTEWLDDFAKQDKPVLFIGQDVELHQTVIVERLGMQAQFALGAAMLPRAAELARLGHMQEAHGSTHDFVPNYHQLAEAEAKWRKMQKEKSGNND